jgi:hypothetical protein
VTFLAAGLAGTALAGSSTNSSTISNVEPGLLGFLVVAALAVALVFLLRSMNKQFRKIGPRPEDPEPVAADEAGAPRAAAATDQAGRATGAGLPQADTGVGFVPDTGAPSGRGGGS